MNEPAEFSPEGEYPISLCKEREGLLSPGLARSPAFPVPSVGFGAYGPVIGGAAFGIVAYGILPSHAIYRMSTLKRNLVVISCINREFDVMLQGEQDGA